MNVEGAIILIRYKNLYLMGKETTYLTDDDDINKDFFDTHGKTLYDNFLFKGTEKDAKLYFTNLCKELETEYNIKVTYADFKESTKHKDHISAKPRYVTESRENLYGFPKGSYEEKDRDFKNTAKRECYEETGLVLDKDRIENTGKTAPTGRKSHYAIYHYKIIDEKEFRQFAKTIKEKNRSRENELQDLEFKEIPKGDPRDFFTNVVSKEAYERTCVYNLRAGRKTRRKKLISKRSHPDLLKQDDEA